MTPRAIAQLVPAVRERSAGRCEVVPAPGYRCRSAADEIHHRLPRSRASRRGDHLLDMAGATHHLADLCLPHHQQSHSEHVWAREAWLTGEDGGRHSEVVRVGLMVAGTVSTTLDGSLVYTGPHPEFTALYPDPGATDRALTDGQTDG